MTPALLAPATRVPSGPVSLSLVKISHCTTMPGGSNMPWKHQPSRDGMFAVFDTVRRRSHDGSVTEMRMLKIIDKNNYLVGSFVLESDTETPFYGFG